MKTWTLTLTPYTLQKLILIIKWLILEQNESRWDLSGKPTKVTNLIYDSYQVMNIEIFWKTSSCNLQPIAKDWIALNSIGLTHVSFQINYSNILLKKVIPISSILKLILCTRCHIYHVNGTRQTRNKLLPKKGKKSCASFTRFRL